MFFIANREIKDDVCFSREGQKFYFCRLAFVRGNEYLCVCRECVIFSPIFSEGFILEFDKKVTK